MIGQQAASCDARAVTAAVMAQALVMHPECRRAAISRRVAKEQFADGHRIAEAPRISLCVRG